MRILTIFGTRPEAIKLAPVIEALQNCSGVEHAACVTGQHREMLDSVLDLFSITPQFDLNIMRQGQDLSYVTTSVLEGVSRTLDEFRPDWVIVQGDTTTAMAGALAAFYKKIKVAHVEAGLRTGNVQSPWPEEVNRKLISQLASIHFPPTERAAANLRREGVPEADLLVTGNTVIDALQLIDRRIASNPDLQQQMAARFGFLDPSKRLILVTGHRRENFDGGLAEVCRALVAISRRGDVQIVYAVHLNPNVRSVTQEVLAGSPGIHLIPPQEYLPFVYLMRQSYLIVSDSGGIQEEAPGLGKPVLVTRNTTERPEAIEAGTARLVGTSYDELVLAMSTLLDEPDTYASLAQAKNPFGDGKASGRIVARLLVADDQKDWATAQFGFERASQNVPSLG